MSGDKIKAVALFSGGLDSMLAAKIVMEQGVEVVGLHLDNGMSAVSIRRHLGLSADESPVDAAASEVGIELVKREIYNEFLPVLLSPSHGYGSGANPCIDCRILMLKKAKEFMEEIRASFVITGEVVGQRPMSQRPSIIKLIEREAGLKGLVLRPLSAKYFPPTLPEKEGWVKRDELLDIRGRSRKRQLELAEHHGFKTFSQPAGGCMLTDESFSRKFFDLTEHLEKIDIEDVWLLYVGRHFRISSTVKLILGRNEEENEVLVRFRGERPALWPEGYKGPYGLFYGDPDEIELLKSARILARYSKKNYGRVTVLFEKGGLAQKLCVAPFEPEEVEKYRI